MIYVKYMYGRIKYIVASIYISRFASNFTNVIMIAVSSFNTSEFRYVFYKVDKKFLPVKTMTNDALARYISPFIT